MAELADLPRELARLIGAVMREVAELAATPWHLAAYCEACGVPAVPAGLIDRIRGFEVLEDAAETLRDALEILDGLVDAVAAADAGDGFDAVWRMFYPIVVVCTRRDPSLSYWYPLFAIPMVLDDRLGEHFASSFTVERVGRAVVSVRDQLAGGTDDNALLWWLFGAAFLAFLVPKVLPGLKRRLGMRGSPEHTAGAIEFAYGWESHLPVEERGDPPALTPPGEPDRPLPIWIAQRTFSLRAARGGSPFTLARYADPGPPAIADEPDLLGVTIVPLPRSTGRSALYLQVSGSAAAAPIALGRGWQLRVRGHTEAGFVFPIPRALSDVTVSGAAAGAGVEVELAWSPKVAPPADLTASDQGGASGGLTVDLAGFTAVFFAGGGVAAGTRGPSASFDDLGVTVRVQKARLALTPKSAVAKALLKGGLTVALDLGMTLSARTGLTFEGAAGLDLYLALRRRLGNKWLGAELSYVRLAAVVTRADDGTALAAEGTAGVAFSLGGVTLSLDGVGARATLATGRPGGSLGVLGDLAIDVVKPSGLGVTIEWGPVHGGGRLIHDPAVDRYAGAVEIALGSQWTLRGVGMTEPRPGGGTSTLVSATFERAALSPTFDVTGFGFLLALHRRGDGEAMRAALATGELEAMLFPPDPLGRTAELVAALARMFPVAEDVHVFGLMIKLSFAKGLVTAKLGFLVQFATGPVNQTKIFVALSAVLAPPAPLDRILYVKLLGIGEYDAASGELDVRARLVNSRLCGADLVGEVVVFRGDPDPGDGDDSRGLFVSIGGYHPKYFGGKGPGKARVDQRLAVVLARGSAVRLDMQFYLALTPSAFHLGARAGLRVEASGFGVEGSCGFDGFVTSDWDFELDVFGSVKLILFSRTITELRLEGTLAGQNPWRIAGSVSFKVLWWSVSKSFDKVLSDERGSAAGNDDVMIALRAAVRDPGSYDTTAPGGVVLTRVARTGAWIAPERPVRMVQTVAPLDTPIERFGRTPLARPTTLRVERVAIGNDAKPTRPTTGEFAPGLYHSLRTEAALAAPAAERLPAGFELGADAVTIGDEVGATGAYDELVIDRQHHDPVKRRGLTAAGVLGAVAPRLPAVVAPIGVRPGQFLTPEGATSFTAAHATRRGRLLRRED